MAPEDCCLSLLATGSQLHVEANSPEQVFTTIYGELLVCFSFPFHLCPPLVAARLDLRDPVHPDRRRQEKRTGQ